MQILLCTVEYIGSIKNKIKQMIVIIPNPTDKIKLIFNYFSPFFFCYIYTYIFIGKGSKYFSITGFTSCQLSPPFPQPSLGNAIDLILSLS